MPEFTCRRTTLTQKLNYKMKAVERAQNAPDPREEAPELKEQLQVCSQNMLKLVRRMHFLHMQLHCSMQSSAL